MVKGSPAETAGLKGGNLDSSGVPASGGDAIKAIDGNAIKTMDDLSNYISSKKAGDQVKLTIVRNNQSMDIQVTLGTRPANAFG